MSFFDGCRGRIFHDRWLPDRDVHGVVVLLHGYGEHLGLYEAFARRLNADGFAVHALDAVGHGRSEGERAVIASWDHFVDDAVTLIGIAREQHPGVPTALVGHSGGGLAAMLVALRYPEYLDAVVLSGAPLRRLPWAAEELALNRPESDEGEPVEFLSTHPEYVDALLHDPLTWKGGFKRETLLAVEAAWPEVEAGIAAGRPDLPTLFVHGEADPLVPVADSREIAAALPRTTLRTFPGDLHDVLNEHDRDTVHDAVAEFVGHHCGARV